MSKHFLATTLLVGLAAACTQSPAEEATGNATFALATGDVVISAVYPGGGPGGAFNRQYVELLNRTAAAADLTGLSLQYASATEAFGANILPLTGSIPARSYWLVALAPTDATGGTALPTPDQNTTGASTLTLSPTAGKVALSNTTASLACGTSSNRCGNKALDLVGYGSVSDFEGSSIEIAAQANAGRRKGSGCTDTNNNASDFEVAAAAPRNSATTPLPDCSTPRDAGADAAPKPKPPAFGDPDAGEESPFDAGNFRDAGRGGSAGGGVDDEGCQTAGGPGSFLSMLGLLGVAALFTAKRRSKPRA